jgi:hypothetical protein
LRASSLDPKGGDNGANHCTAEQPEGLPPWQLARQNASNLIEHVVHADVPFS